MNTMLLYYPFLASSATPWSKVPLKQSQPTPQLTTPSSPAPQPPSKPPTPQPSTPLPPSYLYPLPSRTSKPSPLHPYNPPPVSTENSLSHHTKTQPTTPIPYSFDISAFRQIFPNLINLLRLILILPRFLVFYISPPLVFLASVYLSQFYSNLLL